MNGFILKNPNGRILAVFFDRGFAVQFCHQNGYPEKWIQEGEITVKIRGFE